MNSSRHFLYRIVKNLVLLVVGIAVASASDAFARERFQVLTRAYNNQRTAANTFETKLKPSNVNAAHFGKLFMLPVDDQIYAGLLYAVDVPISGRKHNVLYVETVNNSVYAFDADKIESPLWYRNFNGQGRPTHNTEVGQACRIYHDFIGNIGIIGTPVIGPDKTMYFVSRTVEATGTVQRLHAIDIASGDERPGSPQVIEASVPGKGDDTNGSTVRFNPLTENQRPALALNNGVVYIGWASFCDTRPYHGWLMSYDATSLKQLGVFNASPDGNMAGIWMSGAAPAFDSQGNIYVSTGNGTYDGTNNFGESLIKLEAKTLRVLDYFTPSNFNTLNDFDLDFGTQGPTMLPGTNLLVVGGKEGKMYVVDITNMGKQAPGDIQIPQVLQAVDATVRPTISHHMHNAIPAWRDSQGLNIFVWGESDFLRTYRLDPTSQKFSVPATAIGSILPPSGMPGGMMTISSDGSRSGTGILWSALPRAGDANQMTVPGDVYAFDAETLKLLWSSSAPGDDPLNFAKGSPPIVANGKVYVASISNFVSVYGLRRHKGKSQDLALNAHVHGSAPCDPTQVAEKAVNGSTGAGPADKWCSSAPNPFLQIDLGHTVDVSRFVVEHAGAGGDDFNLNTSDFNIQVSTDGNNFQTVANVSGNIQSITTHDIVPTPARFVRLNVVSPDGTKPVVANIYELQVFSSRDIGLSSCGLNCTSQSTANVSSATDSIH
ncbi:MAG TPA: discoidin domain-containing protein [Terriglobales bacterium]|nr:discoidin domain-containing protein [Terriglobales bacterium]